MQYFWRWYFIAGLARTGHFYTNGEIPTLATILVVEDDPIVLSVIKNSLELQEHSVISAENCCEVESLLNDSQPLIDLVLTDYNLPDGSGLANIQVVQKKNQHAKAILMSSDFRAKEHADSDIKFLYKPFALSILKQAVDATLSLKTA